MSGVTRASGMTRASGVDCERLGMMVERRRNLADFVAAAPATRQG